MPCRVAGVSNSISRLPFLPGQDLWQSKKGTEDRFHRRWSTHCFVPGEWNVLSPLPKHERSAFGHRLSAQGRWLGVKLHFPLRENGSLHEIWAHCNRAV